MKSHAFREISCVSWFRLLFSGSTLSYATAIYQQYFSGNGSPIAGNPTSTFTYTSGNPTINHVGFVSDCTAVGRVCTFRLGMAAGFKLNLSDTRYGTLTDPGLRSHFVI